MLGTIINAIKSREKLSLTYKNIPRVVEPHAVGVSAKGNDILRCYQTQGAHIKPGHEWDLLTVAKIEHLTLTGQHFAGPRPNYKSGDKSMTTIYAEL